MPPGTICSSPREAAREALKCLSAGVSCVCKADKGTAGLGLLWIAFGAFTRSGSTSIVIHPRELTPEVMMACAALANAGIPLNAQIVLLQGVNDSPAIIKELCQRLVRARVRPYYLYQCDPVKGALHFHTRVEKGIEIIESLRGHTTGFAVPTYVIDAPGGGGKVPVSPDYVLKREGSTLILRNFKNAVFRYPDPPEDDM